MHLARLNHLEAATAEIAALRAELGTAMDPEAGAWVLLTEGVLHFFQLDLDRSFDRLRRSYGIGKSARVSTVLGLSSAWLAHVSFHIPDYERACDYVLESLNSASPVDHAARFRAASVVAQFFGYSDQPDEARAWTTTARKHATAEGDEASIAALLFNTTIYRINGARLAHAFSEEVPPDFGRLVLELNSSLNFDTLAEGAGHPMGPVTLKGHASVIEGKYGDAVMHLESALSGGVYESNRATIEADLAHCLWQLGDLPNAQRLGREALSSIQRTPDPDDRAFVYKRLASVGTDLGTSSAELEALAAENLSQFRTLQDFIRQLCAKFPTPVSV
jgi:tetratricopeptide (TPR) repeat protein